MNLTSSSANKASCFVLSAALSLAGRWDRDPEPIKTFTIITTEPNELLAPIHNRMPVILDPADFDAWLMRGPSPIAQAILRPYPAEQLRGPPYQHPRQQHQE